MTTPDLRGRLSLDDQASAKLKGFTGRLQAMKGQLRAGGLALTALGGALTGLAAISVKSSLEQQIGINRLDAALKLVGTSYDAQKDAIEEVIEAQQRKTNFGDEEQRKALVLLTGVLGDHEKALQVLPTVLDSAAFSGKDLNAVLQTMPRFFAGVSNTSIAAGITVDKLATFEERLAKVQENVNGAAAAAADPLRQMQNRMGDAAQVIGDVLLPFLAKLAIIMEKVTRNFIEWTKEHPQLIKFLVVAGAAVGALALVLGPLLIILPGLAVAIGIVTGAAAPWLLVLGAVILVVAGVSAAVILLRKNWETIWGKIMEVTETAVNVVIQGINLMTFTWRKQIEFMLIAIQKVVGFFNKDWADAIQTAIDIVREGVKEIDIYTKSYKKLDEELDESAGLFANHAQAMEESSKRGAEAIGTMTKEAAGFLEELTKIAQKNLDDRAVMHQNAINQRITNQRIASERAKRIIEDESAANRAAVDELAEGIRKINLDRQAAADISQAADQRIRDSAQKVVEKIRFQESALGQLGATQDIVTAAFRAGGGSLVELEAALIFVERAGGGLDLLMKVLKLSVDDVAKSIGKATDKLVEFQSVGGKQAEWENFQKRISDSKTKIDALRRATDELLGKGFSPSEIRAGGAGPLPFQHGGVVPGPIGAPQLAVVHGGEEVLTRGQRTSRGGRVLNVIVNHFAPSFESRQTVATIWRDVASDGGFIEFIGE